jgi:hypothetical protein
MFLVRILVIINGCKDKTLNSFKVIFCTNKPIFLRLSEKKRSALGFIVVTKSETYMFKVKEIKQAIVIQEKDFRS